MAITMIDSVHVVTTPFEHSHLLTKLRKAVLVARIVGDDVMSPSPIHAVVTLDLTGAAYTIVERDYELVRECIADSRRGFDALTGRMGTYIQPRTKGTGHGSTSRAFYARKCFLGLYCSLSES